MKTQLILVLSLGLILFSCREECSHDECCANDAESIRGDEGAALLVEDSIILWMSTGYVNRMNVSSRRFMDEVFSMEIDTNDLKQILDSVLANKGRVIGLNCIDTLVGGVEHHTVTLVALDSNNHVIRFGDSDQYSGAERWKPRKHIRDIFSSTTKPVDYDDSITKYLRDTLNFQL